MLRKCRHRRCHFYLIIIVDISYRKFLLDILIIFSIESSALTQSISSDKQTRWSFLFPDISRMFSVNVNHASQGSHTFVDECFILLVVAVDVVVVVSVVAEVEVVVVKRVVANGIPVVVESVFPAVDETV